MSKKNSISPEDFIIKPLSCSSDDEYIQKANDSINAMVRKQIYQNNARSALYTLHFICQEEAEGRDSFQIVEALKRFMLSLAQEDEEIGRQAEHVFEENRSRNRREAKKFEDLLNTKATP